MGGRLQLFWQVWLSLGANPRVVSILKEGYSLLFKIRPPLSRSPVIVSHYSDPVKNKHLKESLQALVLKQAVEKVMVPSSLAFYNRLFLVPKPNNKWRPILDLRQLNLYLASASFKMETPETIRLSLQKGEWVTSLDFSDAYFHVPISPRSRKYLGFHLNGRTYQFTALPFGLSTAPLEFTKVVKEVKLMAQSRGIRIHQYLDDWLVRAPCQETCKRHTQTLLDLCCQYDKVRTVSPTGVQLCRLPFRPLSGLGQTNAGEVVHPVSKDQSSPRTTDLLGQAIHVPHRASDGYRETGGFGTPSHEAYSMAFKEALACPRILREDNPHPKVSPCSPEMVVRPGEGPEGSTSTPITARPSALYRHLKRRLGRTLRGLHGKRPLVQVRRRIAHKFARTQCGPFSPKTVRAVVLEPDHSGLHGQHDCGCVHQQGMGYEVRLSLCSPLETPSLVQPKADCFTSQAYSGSPECHCRQAVPARTDNSDGMGAPARGFQSPLQEMAQTGNRFVCDKVQSQTSQVCIPGSGQVGLGSRCAESSVERSGRVCLPSDSSPRSSGHKVVGPRLSAAHLDCTRMAQHAMVLGSGQSISSSTSLSATGGELVDSTVQSMSSQKSLQSEPSCLAPRASAIKQAGFSVAVATRIEAPQRRSTRAIYESKWAVFIRWCEDNKVDLRSPSIKEIADFLLFLFQERGLQPGTIEGYRTAIADQVGNTRVNISKDENLTRLLDSFHRDKPKGRRGIPSWNLSLVLHQLTKPPFEPLRKASLKHLTFKTVFLLDLGSGKRRSEVHAWVHKNIRQLREETERNPCLGP